MSNVIDDRVVRMEFDNQRFEQNVSTSISTLDKLKAALKLDGATNGLESIERQARSMNLGSISSAVDTISNRFTSLGVIATTILQDIGHQAFLAGQRILGMVNSLTIKQISAGWDKYAQKTEAVQTIMAATAESWREDANNAAILNNLMEEGMTATEAKQYASVWQQYNDGALNAKKAAAELKMTQDEFLESVKQTKEAMEGYDGSQMEYVNDQMAKLNWFTDETSYNFTDMVSNIGKFTSNGVALSDAVTSMQGIATWAAMSGGNAATASRAMFQLSQAMGMGLVKVQDWQSIESANMATTKFKETAIETALAMGTLQKNANGTITTVNKGLEVTSKNFRSTLAAEWFTSDVLVATLDKYGAFTNELYKVSEASQLTATDLLSLVEAAKEGSLSQEMLNEALGEDPIISAEELASSIELLASSEYDLGYQSLKAAQEAKTFQEAIDSVKDAASTKWMNIFENLFGDYEKARHIWTDFANFLYDIFITPLERLEELSVILGRLDAVKRVAKALKDISNFLFMGDDDKKGILGSLKEGFEEVIPPLRITTEQLAHAIDQIRHFAANLELSDEQVEKLKNAGAGLANILKIIWNSLKNAWEATEPLRTALIELATAIGDAVLKLFGSAKDLDDSGAKFEWLKEICEALADVINFLADVISGVDISGLSTDFSFFSDIVDTITSGLKWLGDKVQGIIDGVINAFNKLKEFLVTADWGAILKTALISILSVIGIIKLYFAGSILTAFHRLKEVLTEIMDTFWSMNLERLTAALKNFAIAIGILALALLVLSYVDYEKAAVGIVMLAGILVVLFAAMDAVSKAITGGQLAKLSVLAGILIAVAVAMLIFAVALAVLAGAVALFALVAKMDTVNDGLNILAITLIMVVAAMAALSKMSPKVIVAAAALLIIAVALIALAGALALFALVSKMGDAAAYGLLYLTATLAVVCIALGALGDLFKKNAGSLIAAAAAILIVSAALLVMAAAFAAFALIAKMGDAAIYGLLYMTATLAVVCAALAVLGTLFEKNVGPLLAAAGALLIASVALLVLAAAFAAFALVANMDSAGAGLGMLVIMLVALTGALILLGGTGPVVLAGAAALLVAAAACLILAAAVAVVALALPLLAAGLAALGAAIGSALSSIGQGAQDFLVSLSDALVAVGDALAEIITAIAESLGTAVSTLGEGVGEAITAIIASVGEGIGQGITAISDAIGTFGENLTNAGLGITNFGDGVRSLKGIDWIGTAAGIADLAKSLKKLKPADLATEMKPASEAIVTMCTEMITALENTMTSFEGAGQRIVNSFVSGINNAMGSISGAGTRIINSIVSAIMIAGEMGVTSQRAVSLGKLFGNGFVKGINEKLNKIRESGISVIDSLIGGAMSKNGEAEVAGGSLVQTITDAFSQAFQLLNGEGEGGGLQEAGAGMVTSLIAGITASTEQVDTSGQALGLALVAGFGKKQEDFETAATTMSTDAAGKINETQRSWSDAGEYLGQGLIAGINNMEGPVMEAASALAEKAAEAIRAALDINSPSRVTTRFGEYFGMGFINGISSQIGGAESVSSAMVNATVGALDQARSLISRILEDDFTPVITPVLDTSMIQGSLNSMSNLSVSAGVRNARSIGSVASLGQIQNGTPTPTTAVLSDSAIRALAARQTTPNKTVIEFTGDLAQLARVLHPVIVDQYNYHGDKLIN